MAENMRDMTLNLIVNSQVNKIKDFNKELKNTQNSIQKTQEKAGWLNKSLRRLFSAYVLYKGVKGFVNTFRQIDMVERSLNALTGSAELGAKHFEFLQKAAFQTGTGIMEVAKAYRGYYYAAKTAGLADQELQHSFLGVMIGARVLGANKVQVSGAMLALEQMLNKTTVQAEEMNRQLGNAISGAREMSAEAMGMSVAEFTEKMQKKQIKSAEFVKKFGDYMYKQFIKKLPEAMKSLDAQIINLGNAWVMLQREFGKTGIGKELTRIVASLMKIIMSPKVIWAVQTLGAAFASLLHAVSYIIDHIKVLVYLLGPVVLGAIIDKLVGGVRAIVLWVQAGNLALSQTQKFLVALTVAFLFIEDFIFFLQGKKSLLEIALFGEDGMSAGERLLTVLIEIGVALGTIYTVCRGLSAMRNALGFIFGRGIPKGVTKADLAKGGAGGLALAGKQGAEMSKILHPSGRAFTKAEIELMKQAPKNGAGQIIKNPLAIATAIYTGLADIGNKQIAKMGINPMSISPYSFARPMTHTLSNLTRSETYAPNITYSPQTKIEVKGNSPQEILAQIKGFLDERDRNFWTKITNPATSLIPNFAGGKN